MPTADQVAFAQERLAARARRIRTIRRRVLAATLATFALAWGAVVYDGSMGATSTVASTGTTTSATDTVIESPTATPDESTTSTYEDDSTASSTEDGATLTTTQS